MSAIPSFISRNVLRGSYLFLNLQPKVEAGFSVACAGWEECSSEYLIERNDFHFPALEYIASGDWELETPHGKWILRPGMVFCYGPGMAYSLKAVSQSGLGKYFVDFRGKLAATHLRASGLHDGKPKALVQRRWLQDLLDQLIETAQLRSPARRRVAQLIADLLLERIREDVRPTERVCQSQLTYERCRRYLADHYLQISSLSDTARMCGVSPVHLSRLFQRFATQSPQAYLTRLKMNHAAELIARGNLPVKAAAAEVGFEDAYYFSRVFKKTYGVAPSRFSVR